MANRSNSERLRGFCNDCPYRIKRIGLCLVLLIFCQTKSDCQHRFTNHPVQLFFSDIESRDSISASALSETFYPVWTIIGLYTTVEQKVPNQSACFANNLLFCTSFISANFSNIIFLIPPLINFRFETNAPLKMNFLPKVLYILRKDP